ncbi:hypothetical protein SteCoe_18657 [Stentor coeruleus]|uniref:RBR-type E3 ubiquitin transferase n=1 Tax=Stentor coeruleus TaxID=5963 RepID=A0A1R2BW78_9CILI|nr:hypothetical protein SteCoe_18657 [Stentor coeruleus]
MGNLCKKRNSTGPGDSPSKEKFIDKNDSDTEKVEEKNIISRNNTSSIQNKTVEEESSISKQNMHSTQIQNEDEKVKEEYSSPRQNTHSTQNEDEHVNDKISLPKNTDGNYIQNNTNSSIKILNDDSNPSLNEEFQSGYMSPSSAKDSSCMKKLMKEQKNMPGLREERLQKLNDSIDKTQACIFCQIPIDENDISFSLLCKHRSCYICIYNRLQDIIGGGENQLLLCTCDAVIYIYLLVKDIEPESIDLYVEMISGISKIDTSLKSYCPYDLHLSKKFRFNPNHVCKKCKNKFCQKCGLAHITQTCLEFYNEVFKEEMKAKLPKCTECKENLIEIELGCECQLCLKCCKSIIKDFLYKEDPMNDPVCIKHNIMVPRMYIYQAFGGQNFFIKEQEKAIDFMILSPKFVCEICLLEFSINQSITLDCDHRFCGKCMKSYLNTLMKESSYANKIGCPKCNEFIHYEALKSNSDPDIFERFLKFTVMVFQPEDKVEVMKWCVNCDYGCTIPIDKEKFTCPNCESEYCPKCNKKHFSSKCEDLRSTKTEEELKVILRKSDEFFKNFMKDFIKCPNCGEAIQKKAGCNFLTCTWPRCKGICFCAICNKILTKDQHYSHYKISGPFGVTCNTTDEIEEE